MNKWIIVVVNDRETDVECVGHKESIIVNTSKIDTIYFVIESPISNDEWTCFVKLVVFRNNYCPNINIRTNILNINHQTEFIRGQLLEVISYDDILIGNK